MLPLSGQKMLFALSTQGVAVRLSSRRCLGLEYIGTSARKIEEYEFTGHEIATEPGPANKKTLE